MFKAYTGIVHYGNSEMDFYIVEQPTKIKQRLIQQFGENSKIELFEISPYLIPEEELELEDLSNLYKIA